MDSNRGPLFWAVDAGNSSVKLGVFDGDTLTEVFQFNYPDFEREWHVLMQKHCPEKIVFSSVGPDMPQDFLAVATELKSGSKIPFTIQYENPQTLGIDRITASMGAKEHFPESKNMLVVDLGSCDTFTKVDDSNIQGLCIIPGLEMRWKAMHHFTKKLPLVNGVEDISAAGTIQNLVDGGKVGWQMEVKAWIQHFCDFHDIDRVVLTGSDVVHLDTEKMKGVSIVPFLNLHGIKAWMND
jgi:type III pantothenate kinase